MRVGRRTAAYVGAAAVALGAVAATALALIGRGPSGPAEIVFERGEGVNPAIYAISADGSGHQRLVSYGSEPTWSPGGGRIAFVVHSPPEDLPPPDELWIVNAAGGDSRRVLRARWISTPVWSPDGSQIAFVTTHRWGHQRISIVDLRAGRRRVLALDDPSGLDWSPDGRELLTMRRDSLVALDIDNGGTRTIMRKLTAWDLTWSPDGTRIAYVADPNPPRAVDRLVRPLAISFRSSLFVVNTDGTGSRRLTSGALDQDPSWAPDGETIVFARTSDVLSEETKSEIYSVSVAGRQLRRLTHDDVDDARPNWRPRRQPEPPLRLTRAPLPEPSVRVPDVIKLAPAEATRRIEDADLKAVAVFVGGQRPPVVVTMQSPPDGARVPAGTVVRLFSWDTSDPYAGRRFDRSAWRGSQGCAQNTRRRMVQDLRQRVLRRGITRQRLLELLGPPDRALQGAFEYALGSDRYCKYLRIELDAAARVEDVFVASPPPRLGPPPGG